MPKRKICVDPSLPVETNSGLDACLPVDIPPDACIFPVELWLLVFQNSCSWQARLICRWTEQNRVLVQGVNNHVLCCALNAACRDGHLQLLQWLVRTYNITFSRLYSQFPYALAIEQGHTHILKYLFPHRLKPGFLCNMVNSVPRAINAGHWGTVEWVVETLQQENISGIGSYKLSTIQRCITTMSVSPLLKNDWHSWKVMKAIDWTEDFLISSIFSQK